jgi:sec-independent protein translocase protein TatA
MLIGEIFGVDGIIVIVVVAILLLFGGTALPKLARGLGSARHEFEAGIKEGDKTGSGGPVTPQPAGELVPASNAEPQASVGEKIPDRAP